MLSGAIPLIHSSWLYGPFYTKLFILKICFDHIKLEMENEQ